MGQAMNDGETVARTAAIEQMKAIMASVDTVPWTTRATPTPLADLRRVIATTRSHAVPRNGENDERDRDNS